MYLQEWSKFYVAGTIGNDGDSCVYCSVANKLKTAIEILMEGLAEGRAKAQKSRK